MGCFFACGEPKTLKNNKNIFSFTLRCGIIQVKNYKKKKEATRLWRKK